ncbi:protein I'm not dead yet-like [Periplaneta americana]|uniref:protein I'm not dead yet-like n=1 Tax=Periplaneta americana TaxID=6978 RepID=UPI0037E87F44
MVIYFATQVIPMALIAAIPIVFLPALGVSTADTICMQYFREANMTFIGVYFLAYCVEYSGLYVRIALKWMMLIGFSHCRLTFGLFSITAFSSMCIMSNVTTSITVSVVIKLLQSLEQDEVLVFNRTEEDPDQPNPTPSKTTTCYVLGVVYSANIGGTASVVGACTNLAARTFVDDFFENKIYYIQFQRWLAACILPAALEIVIVWLWLNMYFMGMCWKSGCDPELKSQIEEGKEKRKEIAEKIGNSVRKQYDDLGPITWYEIITLVLIILAVILMILRDPVWFPGWEQGFQSIFKPIKSPDGEEMRIKDPSVFAIIIFLMNAIPSTLNFIHFFRPDNDSRPTRAGTSLIPWKATTKRFPWSIFFTVGGGFAMYLAMKDSELLEWLDVKSLREMHHGLILSLACLCTVMLTQVMDSVVVFFICAPIFGELCKNAKIYGSHVIVAIGVCCSFCFLFPWRSIPNAIAYQKIKTSIKDMVIAGIVPLVFSLAITVASFMFIGKMTLDV